MSHNDHPEVVEKAHDDRANTMHSTEREMRVKGEVGETQCVYV